MALPSPPTRPALRARYEARRKQVVETAAKLFADQGYAGTSMSDLTKATRLAAGGLYHYIEGKEDLLVAICDELLDPLLEQARQIVSTQAPAPERLRTLLQAWLSHIATHRHHMLVFAQERRALERDPRWRHIRQKRHSFEQILDNLLSQAEPEGAISFQDRHLALLALLGMVNYTAQWLRPRGRLSPAEIADGYCDLLLRPSA